LPYPKIRTWAGNKSKTTTTTVVVVLFSYDMIVFTTVLYKRFL
jgi:hypothetical protein